MFFAMSFFEWLAPFARSEQKKGFRILFHPGISISNSIVLYLIMTWPILAAIAYARSHGVGVTHLLGLTGWVEIVATLVAFDF
jgi:hypothetical protein